MKFLKIIMLIMLLNCFMQSFAAPALSPCVPMVLTLHDAVVLSLRYNPNVQTAEAQRIIDRFSLRVAYWNYEVHYGLSGLANHAVTVTEGVKNSSNSINILPTATLLTPIGTQLSLQLSNNQNINPALPSGFYNPAITASLTQPLLQGFGRDVALAPLHQAQYQEWMKQLTLKNTIMQTITSVIGQYAAVSQAENSIKVQELSLKNSIETLKQQQALLKIGRIAPADLIQFQSSLASQRLMLRQQEVNLSQQKRTLLTTLGIDPLTEFITTKNVRFVNESLPSLQQAIDLALKYNIAYQQELLGLQQLKIAMTLAEDQQRWQLNFTASHTRGGVGGSITSGFENLVKSNNYNSTVGLALTVPIDNLQLKQSLAQARVGLHQGYIRLEAQKRQVVNDVINAYNTVLNQKQQINQAQLAVQLAQQSLSVAEAKLRYGRTTSFEVSTLQSTLTTQELSLINTVTAYVTNLATLDQTIGMTLERWKIQMRYC